MIIYQENLDNVTAEKITGFFVGWPSSPPPETFLKMLENSFAIGLAIDADTGKTIGFINAVSDGILSAYIPLLEVLPEYQKKGIGAELTSRMLKQLGGLYMVDVVCDHALESFYKRAGFTSSLGMIRRNYDAQSGRRKTR